MSRQFRQRLQKETPILFGVNPRVQDDHHAFVGSRANQTSEPLPEFDRSFGKLIVGEGAASGGFDRFQPGFQQGVIRDGKGKLRDDHVCQGVAGHVNTLPKAVGTKQNTSRIPSKCVEQLRSVLLAGLAVQFQLVFGQPSHERLCASLQQTVTGEQHKCVAFGMAGKAFDLFRQFTFKVFAMRRRIRKVTNDNEFGLSLIVKRAANADRQAASQAIRERKNLNLSSLPVAKVALVMTTLRIISD